MPLYYYKSLRHDSPCRRGAQVVAARGCSNGNGACSGSEPTPDDEVSDRNLHRLIALIQHRGLYLDDTLIGARLGGPYLEHLDFQTKGSPILSATLPRVHWSLKLNDPSLDQIDLETEHL